MSYVISSEIDIESFAFVVFIVVVVAFDFVVALLIVGSLASSFQSFHGLRGIYQRIYQHRTSHQLSLHHIYYCYCFLLLSTTFIKIEKDTRKYTYHSILFPCKLMLQCLGCIF